MAIEGLHGFLDQASEAAANLWAESKLSAVASLQAPNELLGRRETVLRSDTHVLWTRWFLEAICDPMRLVRDYPGYAFLFAEVLPEIGKLFPSTPIDERRAVAAKVARLIDAEVRRRQDIRRMSFNRELRRQLWDEAGPQQRCWICGSRFDSQAADEFLGEMGSSRTRILPLFVDYLKPRGLIARDFRIEVDHVIPVSAGGLESDNLRLACGWCNRHKSDYTSIYDVPGESRILRHPRYGTFAAPRPFWVVRVLAVRRRCEWPGGCKATIDSTELTIAPIHKSGALNPMNLQLTCREHDPIGPNRLMDRSSVEQMWAREKRVD